MSKKLTKGPDVALDDSCLHRWGESLDNPLKGIDVQREVQPNGTAPVDRHVTREPATTSHEQQRTASAHNEAVAAYISGLLDGSVPLPADC